MRNVPWIILVFFLVALLTLSGCGQESEDTASEPEETTPTTSQSIGSGNTASDPEVNAAPEQSSEPGESEQAIEARLDDLMAKVNERMDLDDAQQEQVKNAIKTFLISMEQKMQQSQLIGQSGQERQAGTPPHPADGQPEDMAQMKQGQMGGPGQVTQQLQEILTPEQVEEFQKILDELRREMILQQAIEQMGGESTSPDDQ